MNKLNIYKLASVVLVIAFVLCFVGCKTIDNTRAINELEIERLEQEVKELKSKCNELQKKYDALSE